MSSRSEQLDDMTEQDKKDDIIDSIEKHGAVCFYTKTQMAFWSGALSALEDEGKINVRELGSDIDQYSGYEVTLSSVLLHA